jgi:hypothetical protein
MANCDLNTVNSFEPEKPEKCVLDQQEKDWLKIGDSWTLMFTHNPANERDNPSTSNTYGRYYQPDLNRTYWQLYKESFQNLIGNSNSVYDEWLMRADKL